MNFVAALRKEILESWRTHRFLVVISVLVIFGILSPLTAKFMPEIFKMVSGAEQFAALIPEPSVKDAVDQYIKNISQFALIMGILISMGSVVQEKERGTAAMILVKPLPRGAFLLAKLTVLLVIFTASLVLAGSCAYYYTLYLFEPLPVLPWLAMNGLLLIYTMVYVALTIFFSTVGRSQALAGGLSLATMAVLGIIGSIPSLRKFVPANLIDWAASLIQQTGNSAWLALWVSLGIILLAVLGSWLVLRRQEL
jgi:ABC-2 type transport system permease protein